MAQRWVPVRLGGPYQAGGPRTPLLWQRPDLAGSTHGTAAAPRPAGPPSP